MRTDTMDEERKSTSDLWGIVQCLGHVALVFAPFAIGLGLLVMLSAGNAQHASAPDRFVTGTIQKR